MKKAQIVEFAKKDLLTKSMSMFMNKKKACGICDDTLTNEKYLKEHE